ncbi:hypothetical protein ACGFNX_19480 [Streptomyces sp. NPDC048723]|uniref:hypothetical protein n=1 Tax=unclassified Streptomyces TaxID=2593676 RepID=UPI0035645009
MSRTARTVHTARTPGSARLIAAAGLTALLFVGAASPASAWLTSAASGTASTGPGVIGWDSVQAAGTGGGFEVPARTASQVIGWD